MSETKPVRQAEAPVQQPTDSAEVVYRASSYWEKFKKPILFTAAGLALVAAVWVGYSKLVAAPKKAAADEAIWKAQQYFDKDSIRLALYGDGRNAGFEKVAKNYSGTQAGNLAKYYGGICALQLNEPKKAVDFLKDFSTDSKLIQSLAFARLGDAYADLNKNEEAIDAYDKAGHAFPGDEANSAEALFRAGLLSQIAGKNDQAIKYFKEVKEKYPRTERGSRVDEYLASLGSLDSE